MKLIDDWRAVLNRAWSVRMAILTALLGVADQILSAFVGQLNPLVYTGMMALIIIVRVLEQSEPKPS